MIGETWRRWPRVASKTTKFDGNQGRASAEMATTIVFVHGFMGNKNTFNTMPQELLELLGPCFQDVNRRIKTEIFAYDSKGTENAAKLYQFIAELEGDVHIVSHSMGGILALDSARLYGMKKMAAPLSNLKGVVSIDTPFWGLSQDVMDIASHTSLIPEPVKQIAQSASSSPWSLFAAATAVAAGVALAASSDSLRERMKNHIDDAMTHGYDTLNFLGPLWQLHDVDSRFNILQVNCLYMYMLSLAHINYIIRNDQT